MKVIYMKFLKWLYFGKGEKLLMENEYYYVSIFMWRPELRVSVWIILYQYSKSI